jgi:hypothetical protein
MTFHAWHDVRTTGRRIGCTAAGYDTSMSVLNSKADIRQTGWIVRVVPTADIKPCYSITSSARSSSEIGLESVVI